VFSDPCKTHKCNGRIELRISLTLNLAVYTITAGP